MFTQTVQIDKKDLINLLDEQMFRIIGGVIKTAQDKDEQDPQNLEEAMEALKPRELNYFAGQATMLLKMIELHGVRVNDSLRNDMKSICRKLKK